jgi:hypothetical protein
MAKSSCIRRPRIVVVNLSMGSRYLLLGKALAADFRRLARINRSILFKVLFRASNPDGRPTSWLKIAVIREELRRMGNAPGWVVWMDSDIAVVDESFRIESLLAENREILFSKDLHGICLGVIALRNTEWTRYLVDALWLLGPVDVRRRPLIAAHERYEQNAMKVLMTYFPYVRERVGLIPESMVINRQSCYSATAGLFHLWMGGRIAQEILNKKRAITSLGWSEQVFRTAGEYDLQTTEDVRDVSTRIEVDWQELSDKIGLAATDATGSVTQALSVDQARRLLGYADALDLATALYRTHRAAVDWLHSGDAAFGGLSPLHVLARANGYAELEPILRLRIDTIRKEPQQVGEAVPRGQCPGPERDVGRLDDRVELPSFAGG